MKGTRLRVYLDNCCFNRPYDNQEELVIRVETELKLEIQDKIKQGQIELAWSYILDYENSVNPFEERFREISLWKDFAVENVIENKHIIEKMKEIEILGIKPLDALHISCAVYAKCDFFITVDKGILKKKDKINYISIVSPLDFINTQEE